MADLKAYAPHIKRAALVNGLFLLYLITPSFLSFAAIAVAAFFGLCSNPCESLGCKQECCTANCLNSLYQKVLALGLIESTISLK